MATVKFSQLMKEKSLLSFEVFPPRTKKGVAALPETLAKLCEFKPEYISCTYGAGGTDVGRYTDNQLPFIGINNPQLMHPYVGVVRTDFRVNVHKKHYLTAMFNYMREGYNFKDMFSKAYELTEANEQGYLSAYNGWGVGVRYTYDMLLGPLSADISYSNYTNKVGFYVSMGYYF